ncbi:LysE family translocator [Halopseudomonas salegens]|nr:LysE family translocator [Halopseudomonas salegens]
MNLIEIVALFVVMTILALIPSTSVALVVVRSSTAGFWSGAAVAAGIVLGDLVFVFFAVLGMVALAEVMGGFFLVLRYMAGLYLIWFGISLLRAKAFLPVRSVDHSAASLSANFASGLIVTLGDVKAIFFYASLFPAFVDLGAVTLADIALIVIITVVAVGGAKLAYAGVAGRVLSLVDGFRARRTLNMTAGGFMLGAGAYVLAKA